MSDLKNNKKASGYSNRLIKIATFERSVCVIALILMLIFCIMFFISK
jgi:hypothetical protein